jgi:hypothetical protein
MSAFGGPNIIDDSLVLYLDAGNSKSYPGSGTTWFDKSGFGNNGTLINGPTFNTGNGGSTVFDGSNDFVRINNGSGINISNIFSVLVWVKFNSFNTVLIGSNDFGDSGYPLYVENSNNLYIAEGNTFTSTTNANLVIGQWVLLTVIRSNTSIVWYKNGSRIGSSTLSTSSVNVVKSIGSYNGGGFYLNGNISSIQIHNRALSASEVLQNYNATKGRFGLL